MVRKATPHSVPLPTPRPASLAKPEVCTTSASLKSLLTKGGTATAAPAASPVSTPTEVVVAKGDTLSAIAGRLLGDENRWEEVFDANRDQLRDPHMLIEGVTLHVPGATPSTPAPTPSLDPTICKYDATTPISRDSIVKAVDDAEKLANGTPTTYEAHRGDSLSRIASKMLGDASRWPEILEANRDVLQKPEDLQPGMTLKMPDSAREVLARNATDAGEEGPVQSGQLWDMARDLGEKYDLDPRLVMAVVQKESGGNPRARSGAGARGLMQLMPDTARSLGVSDPYNPRANMEAGTKYLKQLMRDFGDVRLGLMAYNWGPGNVRSYLRGHKHPPRETRNYVPAVLAYYRQFGGKA